MINRYNDDGCLAGDGALVLYTDYRKLEVEDDAFQKKVNAVLKDLSNVNELTHAPTAEELSDTDAGINDAIGDLEKAFSERTD